MCAPSVVREPHLFYHELHSTPWGSIDMGENRDTSELLDGILSYVQELQKKLIKPPYDVPSKPLSASQRDI